MIVASLSFDTAKGRWRIQFKAPDGSRKSIGLKGSQKAESRAQTLRGRIEELLQAKMTGTAIPRDLAAWVAKLPNETHEQLSQAGLVEARASSELGPFLDEWMREREHEKASTRITWGNAQRNLLSFFGADKPLRDITEADAERFVRWLRSSEKLADNTIRKRCSITKQFFRSAVKGRLLESSPFSEVKGSMTANPKRQRFITEADAQRVLQACPDVEWRLMFALSRWGALRCPSETLALKWQDVDFANGVLHVHASKTEHHEHGGDRVVPIFVELRPLLQEAFEAAEDGAVYVISRHREHSNLGVRLGRIVRQAGLTPWPKIWHNLRASRCTELQREFPNHVVTKWCGHTEGVAEQSYWMTTEGDFAKATSMKVAGSFSGGANVVQQTLATGGNGQKGLCPDVSESQYFPPFAAECEDTQNRKMGDTGLRTIQGNPVKTLVPAKAPGSGGAYVVHSARGGVTWAEVRALILACSEIPEATRGELVALGDQRAGGR